MEKSVSYSIDVISVAERPPKHRILLTLGAEDIVTASLTLRGSQETQRTMSTHELDAYDRAHLEILQTYIRAQLHRVLARLTPFDRVIVMGPLQPRDGTCRLSVCSAVSSSRRDGSWAVAVCGKYERCRGRAVVVGYDFSGSTDWNTVLQRFTPSGIGSSGVSKEDSAKYESVFGHGFTVNEVNTRCSASEASILSDSGIFPWWFLVM